MRKRAYTFKEGLAMMAAKDVGVDPYLAADAGEDARSILAALRHAKTAKGPEKAKHIAAAQTELRKLNPRQHGKLINALQAKVLALQGRGGDTAVAHLEPGEMVVPRAVLTPQLVQVIAAEAAKRGIDPKQLIVGSRKASINPATDTEEFGVWNNVKGWFGHAHESEKPTSDVIVARPNEIDIPFDKGEILRNVENGMPYPPLTSVRPELKEILERPHMETRRADCHPVSDQLICGIGSNQTNAPDSLNRPRVGTIWSDKKIDEQFDKDINAAGDVVKNAIKMPMTRDQYEAMTSLAFSMRPKSFTKSNLVQKFNEGDIEGAAQEFLDFKKTNGETEGGLQYFRRPSESVYFKQGPNAALSELERRTELQRRGVPRKDF
jgi:lysozyme